MSTKKHYPDLNDVEKGERPSNFMLKKNMALNNNSWEMDFLQKLYVIQSVQLFLTAVLAGCFCADFEDLNSSFENNPWVLWLCLLLLIILFIALQVKRHKTPINFILLGTFTIVGGMIVGVFIISEKKDSFFECKLLTIAIVNSIMLYILFSKRNFSKLGLGLFLGFIVLLGMGIINMFYESQGIVLLKSGASVALFSLYIVCDIHKMME